MIATVYPSTATGTIKIPPAKSLAHRSIIAAALANGTTDISNLDYSQDITATILAMEQLGAKITRTPTGLTIKGIANFDLPENLRIDCNESGSTLRFLLPIFALSGKTTSFTGTPRLLSRPLTIYHDIFTNQGNQFATTDNKITIKGQLQPGNFSIPGNVSSQFISGLLFALPLLDEDSQIDILPPFESKSYVDLTIETLENFGVTIAWQGDNTLIIKGGQKYVAPGQTMVIPGDYSQLAFFAVLGALNNSLTCTGVNPNSLQGDKAVIQILQNFGSQVVEHTDGFTFSKSPLKAATIDLANCPDLGPILTVLAACSQGQTIIDNAARLRIKESDRIQAMETELLKLGVDIKSTANQIIINGRSDYQTAYGTKQKCDGHNDHRIVMSLAILAACCHIPLIIEGAEAVAKSYPSFFTDLQSLGIMVDQQK